MTRSLDASITLGPTPLWGSIDEYPLEAIANLSRCSVTVQSLDQIHPVLMQHFVWSWAPAQPDRALFVLALWFYRRP